MLTIFTPTYERVKLLSRVYESLLRQTCHEFVWLIVDDGSTDGTGQLVQEWQKEQKITIRYEYCENGGKMRAHNTGVRLCDTELFLCVDSDDYLTDTAVEEIMGLWEHKRAKEYAGIVAHKGEDEKTPLFHEEFPDVTVSTLGNLYHSGFHGETTLVFRTEILKKYLFPEIPGEKYVPEDYIYDKIDKEYQLIVLPKVLTVCEIVTGGYTEGAAKLRRENPTGWFLYYEQRASWEPVSVRRLKYISHYMRFAKLLGRNVWKESTLSKGALLLGLPGELLLYLADKT